MWLIIFVLGGCSSLAVLTTFRKKDDFSIEEPPLSLIYAISRTIEGHLYDGVNEKRHPVPTLPEGLLI
jgi:hypothetical protein